MTIAGRGIFIVGANRTPFCKYGGYIREMSAAYIFAVVAKQAMRSANLSPAFIDSTVVGNVHYLSQCDGGKTPRYCGLYSGVPIEKPALGVNRGSGSGLQAIVTGSVDILTGLEKICLAGGTEIMSSLPMYARNVRFGTKLGFPYSLDDPLNNNKGGVVIERNIENIAEKYRITRDMSDEYVLTSHMKYKEEKVGMMDITCSLFDMSHLAQASDLFKDEITNLSVTKLKKEIDIYTDELPNTLKLAEVPSILKNGVVTRGNSSAPADGAAALVLADEESVERHNLEPLARVAGWTCVGSRSNLDLPAATAVIRLLDDFKLKTEDVDFFEIHEQFATEAIATQKVLMLKSDVVNGCGGVLVLGDPTAATGARMAVHIAHRLGVLQATRAVAASSCGDGQGIAIMFERV